MIGWKVWAVAVVGLCGLGPVIAGEDYAALLAERSRSVVAVEFFIQREVDREPQAAVGLVLDEQGLIALMDGMIPHWTPVDELRDFKVFIPGEGGRGHPAEYLGVDFLTGWHFLRADASLHERLLPITRYPLAAADVGEWIWGIGIGGEHMDYPAYFLHSRVSARYRLPLNVSFTTAAVAATGGPVFNRQGDFVGWADQAATDEFVLYTGEHTMRIGLQSLNESNAFLNAADLVERIPRFPTDATPRPQPWFGVTGLQAVDREVAPFLGVENQGAVVITDIFAGGPADKAGLVAGDVIVAVDGEALPRMRPNRVVVSFLEEQILGRAIGSEVMLTVLRDGEELQIDFVSEVHTQLLREANRQYLNQMGLTVREYVLYDGLLRRRYDMQQEGAIVSFVRENGPAAAAGLEEGDWIRQVDGQDVADYSQTLELLSKAEQDDQRRESVLLIDRNNETRVLRIKLD